MDDFLILFLVVLGLNILPAFGPPTWTVLVLFSLHTDFPTWLVVLVGAAAAAAGRYALGTVFRLIGSRLPDKNRRNLAAAREALQRSRRNTIVALVLFAISPLPSAQLFEAAGLARIRLLPFTAAFFAGRLVSYFIYVSTAAAIRETNLGDVFRNAFSSPVAIIIEVVLIGLVVAMTRIDWSKWLNRKP